MARNCKPKEAATCSILAMHNSADGLEVKGALPPSLTRGHVQGSSVPTCRDNRSYKIHRRPESQIRTAALLGRSHDSDLLAEACLSAASEGLGSAKAGNNSQCKQLKSNQRHQKNQFLIAHCEPQQAGRGGCGQMSSCTSRHWGKCEKLTQIENQTMNDE